MLGDVLVQIICEKGIELYACQTAFGKQSSVSFYDVHEVARCIATREDYGFATEGSNFCAANVEGVAVVGEPRKVEITFRRSKAVTQTCAVDEKFLIVPLANGKYLLDLLGCIDAAKFRREGDIDHAGYDHVLECRVGIEGFQPGFEFACIHLAAVRG